MANINNLKVDNINYFNSKNGEMCQADVILSGKKIGYWSQDGNGGEDNYDFNLSLLTPIVDAYKKTLPDGFILKQYFDEFMLLHEVVSLTEYEYKWEENVKKGKPVTIVITNGLEFNVWGVTDENAPEVVAALEKAEKKLSNSFMGPCTTMKFVFKDKFDFSICV